MKKRLVSVLLCGVVITSSLSGCGSVKGSGSEVNVRNNPEISSDYGLDITESETNVEETTESVQEVIEYPIEVTSDIFSNIKLPEDNVQITMSAKNEAGKSMEIDYGVNGSDYFLGTAITSSEDEYMEAYLYSLESGTYFKAYGKEDDVEQSKYLRLIEKEESTSEDTSESSEPVDFASDLTNILDEVTSTQYSSIMQTGDYTYTLTNEDGVETDLVVTPDWFLESVSFNDDGDGVTSKYIIEPCESIEIDESQFTEEDDYDETLQELAMMIVFGALSLTPETEDGIKFEGDVNLELSETDGTVTVDENTTVEEDETVEEDTVVFEDLNFGVQRVDKVTGFHYAEQSKGISVRDMEANLGVVIDNGEIIYRFHEGMFSDDEVKEFEESALELADRLSKQ